MLTKYDEFVCHQIVATFDSVETSAREWTERLWFCAHDITGKMMLVAGFGFYPNRNIIDAFACLSVEGRIQCNVRASRELRPRIDEVAVGPFSYQVVEPLRRVRWILADNKHGLSYDIEFQANMLAHEEEPPVVQPDYTKSRDERGADVNLTPANYKITRELLEKKAKPDAILLHSLPRMDEIPTDVAITRWSRYWQEAFNGVVMRMTLLALVLGAME